MKVLLVNNRYKKNTVEMADMLAPKLTALNITVEMEDKNIGPPPDLIIVLGGDGTILRAARQYACINTPILGVNMGTVGFLSNIKIEELEQCLNRLLVGDYNLDQRMMLTVDICQDTEIMESFYCLNELVIRATTPRMVSFNLAIDGQIPGTYRGDGLIIASPTGSTAYSLSAGGPICDPELESFIITPIAPHFIGIKPLVISSRRILEITPVECQDAIICIDGQIRRDFKPYNSIKVRQAEFKLQMVDLKRTGFFSSMANKLRRIEGI
ncbi:MAG: NAD(+)/NADH kinase [Syntrophomonadaceae bacterium]|nr:NAD(+)/NADH kinase [Syntrophomonadaceae bacterium]